MTEQLSELGQRAVQRLDEWLRGYDTGRLGDSIEGLVESARALADCTCRTEHACCPGVYEEGAECTWLPCPDCDSVINGTFGPSIFALADEVQNRMTLFDAS